MTTRTATGTTAGFTAEERAAMKERAAELRAEGRAGGRKADGLQAVLDRILTMPEHDRALAERVHAIVTTVAPHLSARTWYGMPAYANHEGKVVLYFKDGDKFKGRYATLGFSDTSALDDGDMWPVVYALRSWSPDVERAVVRLVRAAGPRSQDS